TRQLPMHLKAAPLKPASPLALTSPRLAMRQKVVGEGCCVVRFLCKRIARAIEDGVMIEHKAGIVGPLFQRLDTPAAGIGDVALALPVLAVVDKAGIFKQVARLLGSSSQQVCSLPWVLRSVGVALGRGAQEATDHTWLLRDKPLAGHD